MRRNGTYFGRTPLGCCVSQLLTYLRGSHHLFHFLCGLPRVALLLLRILSHILAGRARQSNDPCYYLCVPPRKKRYRYTPTISHPRSLAFIPIQARTVFWNMLTLVEALVAEIVYGGEKNVVGVSERRFVQWMDPWWPTDCRVLWHFWNGTDVLL